MVCLNTRAGLAQTRTAKAFRELCPQFAGGPVRVAEAAFLFGRAYGHREAGAVGEGGAPEGEVLESELATSPPGSDTVPPAR